MLTTSRQNIDTIAGAMVIGTKVRTIEPDITVFEIAGRLHLGNNLFSIEIALKKLIDEGCRKVVIDLTSLNYVDSAGVGMLVGMNGHAEQSGGRLRIAGASGPVAKTFDLVHLDRIVALDETVELACGNLMAGGAAA